MRRLKNSVEYVLDKDKTTREKVAEKDSASSLQQAVDYALNRDKTETDVFESSLGCTTQNAFTDMCKTKEQWHKTGGVAGYHLVQSFAAGEVTPELAHSICLALAERILGGKYEAVISTHLNTGHLHNHIVWNSVSLASGKKYHSNARSYACLLNQPEPEACSLALAAELFINGSLNTFAKPTNVNAQSRIVAYDIRELGEQLMPIGMLVTLDAIFNRVIRNWKAGRRTWIFIDGFYLFFRYEYSENFFYKLFKRLRKYNGFITGMTQNVDEVLHSDTARLMLANSEFLVMLNQAATDRAELAKLLNISANQLSFLTNVEAGSGLIRCAGNLVPFENSFPKNTKLYRLMSTKPDEIADNLLDEAF